MSYCTLLEIIFPFVHYFTEYLVHMPRPYIFAANVPLNIYKQILCQNTVLALAYCKHVEYLLGVYIPHMTLVS